MYTEFPYGNYVLLSIEEYLDLVIYVYEQYRSMYINIYVRKYISSNNPSIPHRRVCTRTHCISVDSVALGV